MNYVRETEKVSQCYWFSVSKRNCTVKYLIELSSETKVQLVCVRDCVFQTLMPDEAIATYHRRNFYLRRLVALYSKFIYRR